MAYAAAAIGAKATIVMPRSTPIAKVAATEGYGAEVVLHGGCYDEAYEYAMELREERGATFVHPLDDPDVIARSGNHLSGNPQVSAHSKYSDNSRRKRGLLAGMAVCIKQINPSIRVIGVQSAQADSIVRSYCSDQLTCTDSCTTIADGIAVKKPGEVTIPLIRKYVDDMITVTDDEIAEAILLLLERTKMVVEPAGAAALAAAINRKTDLAGKRMACVLSGGNIDVGFIHKVVEKGLVTRGRQMKFQTVMKDAPGSLQQFSTLLAEQGTNIIMVQHSDKTYCSPPASMTASL